MARRGDGIFLRARTSPTRASDTLVGLRRAEQLSTRDGECSLSPRGVPRRIAVIYAGQGCRARAEKITLGRAWLGRCEGTGLGT